MNAPTIGPNDPELEPIVDACRATSALALVGAAVMDDGGRRSIAMLGIDGERANVAYRKMWLGDEEATHFVAGTEAGVLDIDGWRVGLGICKDTGVPEHRSLVTAQRVDAYVAGVLHHSHELNEQDARGVRIAREVGVPVAFSSFAGPTGGGYATTAGTSCIWTADGVVLARAGRAPGQIVSVTLSARY
jgi:predicted amidohydrolase